MNPLVIVHTVRNYSHSDHGNEGRQKEIHCDTVSLDTFQLFTIALKKKKKKNV